MFSSVVGDLLYAAFKRWKMILALGLLGFICGFALSGVSYLQGNYTSYEISCSIAITSQSSTGAFTNNSSYLSTNDFHLAEDMVDAASFVMKSNRVLQAALDSTGLVLGLDEGCLPESGGEPVQRDTGPSAHSELEQCGRRHPADERHSGRQRTILPRR